MTENRSFRESTFDSVTETVDGKNYQRCQFHNCVLVYRGGQIPSIVDCRFHDCRWEFKAAAERTITLLNAIYAMGPDAQKLIEEEFNQRPPAPGN